MAITPDSLKRDLADGASAAARIARSDGAIRDAGAKRREEIAKRLEELRPTTLTDKDAAAEYQALLAERGKLDLMV